MRAVVCGCLRAALLLLVAGCQGQQNVLAPASPDNDRINTLFWAMTIVGSAVWLVVTVVALWAALSRRRGASDTVIVPGTAEFAEAPPELSEERSRRTTRIISGAVAVTVLILLGFLVYDFGVGRALAAHPARALTVEMVGHQWWWEVHYVDPSPSKSVVDANELHIPAGEPVQVKLRSMDVIHSFWVPNLIGKRDLIPGYTSSLFLNADRPGVYRAQCAEFCGHQHAKMALTVVVHPRDEFYGWLEQQRAPAPEPSDSMTTAGRNVFLSAPCARCHAITGTPAFGTVGPDLTHLASRRTIGAGTLANTKGNLAGWIVDPQSIKPGVRMPSNQLEAQDLQALLAYLESLR